MIGSQLNLQMSEWMRHKHQPQFADKDWLWMCAEPKPPRQTISGKASAWTLSQHGSIVIRSSVSQTLPMGTVRVDQPHCICQRWKKSQSIPVIMAKLHQWTHSQISREGGQAPAPKSALKVMLIYAYLLCTLNGKCMCHSITSTYIPQCK